MSPSRQSQQRKPKYIKRTKSSSSIGFSVKTRSKTILTARPNLPIEITLAIVELLEFDDLKSTRLLSETWSSCASTILFAAISVSPNKEDLEVFEAITQHPQLSKFVRELTYDGSEFLLHLSKHQYLNQLCRQTLSLHEGNPSQAWLDELHSPDTEINSWVQKLFQDRDYHGVAMAKFRKAKFVNEGYQKYHEHAIYQQECLQDGTFFKRLIQGLEKLDFLTEVYLECRWGDNRKVSELRKRSHLARNWNTFHCSPTSWVWGPRTNRNPPIKISDGAEHYGILVSALGQAQRRIRGFYIDAGSAVPPYVFDKSRKTRSAKPLQFHNDNLTAFSGVEELTLRFANYGQEHTAHKTTKMCQNIVGLPAILGSMDHLKELRLRLPGAAYHPSPNIYTYDQVFPKHMRWDSMRLLSLYQISIGARDLVLLILDAMPGLRELGIGEVFLSQGSWEGVFEALKQMPGLCHLDLTGGANFYHHGGEGLVKGRRPESVRDLWPFIKLFNRVATYVRYGGRHPCLERRLPDSAAKEYTACLGPVLQQRLLALDRTSLNYTAGLKGLEKFQQEYVKSSESEADSESDSDSGSDSDVL